MAEPTQAQLDAVTARFMAELEHGENCAYVKSAVTNAVNATNTWQASNAASFNTALPAPFRNNASAKQKAKLFRMVSELRHSTS